MPDGAQSPLAIDITPVDYAAAGILRLMQAPPGTYHLANPEALPLSALLQTLSEWSGLRQIPLNEWRALARERLGRSPDAGSSAALLALCRALEPEAYWPSLDLFQATGFKLASPATVHRLEQAGLRCPPPDRELLGRYFRAFAGQRS